MANRYRNYAFILYPESMPKNWKDIIEEWKVPTFVSPLHDKDVKEDGELKKPHYHALLMFDGVKSKDQVLELVGPLGVKHLENVDSKKGYARYLCHLDSLDKKHYNTNDVICFSSADYSLYSGKQVKKKDVISDILEWTKKEGVYSYSDVLDYALKSDNESWISLLTSKSAIVVKDYLKSKYWSDYNMKSWRDLRKARKTSKYLDEWHDISNELGVPFDSRYDNIIESHNLSFTNS